MSNYAFNHNDELFLRSFLTKERVMLLTSNYVENLRKLSQYDDKLAKYGYGRWLYFLNPYDGAISQAEQLLFETKEYIPDALAAYSQMLRYGETTITHSPDMDLENSQGLLLQAKEQGSILAAITDARNRIHGLYCDAEPDYVATEIEQVIRTEPNYDPIWLSFLADAYQELGNNDSAIRAYEQAIECGDIRPYAYLAFMYQERGNTVMYQDLMEKGIEKGNTLCMIYQADMDDEDYESLSKTEQDRIHQNIDNRLLRGLKMGDGICAYYLWHNHYFGELGYTEDIYKALAYLKEGIRLADSSCIEQMVTLARTNSLPQSERLSDMQICELALRAARYSPFDEDILEELQYSDDPAFLLRHKEELERYWQPLLKQLNEMNEEDGRYDAYV